jgi:gluconolactonase
MKISNWRAAICVALSLCVTALVHAEDKEVKFKSLKLTVPESWESQPPSNNLRLGQFKIAPLKDEGESEIYIASFPGGGGGVDANVSRWISQFTSEGRKVKVTQGKAPQGDYVLADISGTYKQSIGPPVRMQTKEVPDSRMLGVILMIEDEGIYFVKFTGGKETVASQEKAFRKSFGGSAETEKPYEK